MATITATASGGTRNWSDTATWSPAQVPTAADDVVLASTSGNVTVDVNAACRSLDCQASGNYAGTLTLATVSLSIGTSTVAPSSRALRLSSAMTLTAASGSVVQTTSSYAGVQTIDFAGKSPHNFAVWNSAGCTAQLSSAVVASGAITLGQGTLDTNSVAVSCGSFSSSNSNTRTLTLGSSTITCTGAGNAFDVGTVTNLTMTANTATLVLSGTSAGVNNGVGWNPNGLSLVLSGASYAFCNTQACTYANLTRTGTASKNDYMIIYGASVTVTGTFTVAGNSATNRVQVTSNLTGTPRTITAAAVALSNCDVMDIVGAGAASWTGTSLGDCGGNSGITFTTATTRYAVAAGNWSSTGVWSASSGGASGASVPLPQDNVVLNASSGVGTITIDMPRACKDFNMTGYTGVLNQNTNVSIFGSFTGSSSATGSTGGTAFYFFGRGSHTITANGWTFAGAFTVSFSGVGGTYTLAGACTLVSANIQLNAGTLVTAGYTLTCATMNQGTPTSPGLSLGGSTFVLTGSGSVFNCPTLTVTPGTSTIVLADTSAATKTFAGGGRSYNNLTVQGGALNSVVITGANTFNTITAPAGTVLTLPSSTTTTVAGLALTGAAYNGLRLPGVASNYASAPDAAPLRVTGDLEIVCRLQMSDWTPTADAILVVKRTGSFAYQLWLSTTGSLALWVSSNGSSFNGQTASPTNGITDGTAAWIKATWRASDGRTQYFKAADQATEPSSWTQLGTDQFANIGSIYAGTAPLELGAVAGSNPVGGTFYRAIVRNGIGGTTVFDADFTLKPWGADSWVCTTGQTVTINGDLAKAGDGRVLLNSSTPGTKATISAASGTINGDYLVVVDSTATGGATFNAGVRSFLSNTTGWNATGSISKSGRCDVPLAERGSGIKKVPLAGRCDVPVTGRASAAKTVPLAGRCLVPLGDRGSGSKRVPLGGRVVVPVFDGGGNPTKTVQLGGRLIIPILVDVSSSQFGPACVTATIEAPCPGDLRTQGSATVIEATVRADGNLVDPAELTLHLRKPDGTSTTMTRASALHVSAGVYRWRVRLDQAGTWHASVTTDDVGTASTKMPPFYVLATT